MSRTKLNPKDVAILRLIGEGHSYAQIVERHPETTYLDIFAAAREILRAAQAHETHCARLKRVKERYPRAYERWTEAEDASLKQMFAEHHSAREMAEALSRQPSAVHSRLVKLGLTHW